MDDLLAKMGARIRAARRDSDHTLEGLAALLGVSRQSVIDWETGKSRIQAAEPSEKKEPSERSFMEMLSKQQDLLTKAQELLAEQRQDISRLTEVIAIQQAREINREQTQFRERQLEREIELLRKENLTKTLELELIRKRPVRGSQQLLADSPDLGLSGSL